MAMIVFLGSYALVSIPKESSPAIKFGIISIVTSYPGVNPIDIDTLITQHIEAEIKDVDGVKKINSTSNQGISFITVELETDAEESKALVDIKDAVDKADIPTDANDPMVTALSTDNEMMFTLLLYGDKATYAQQYLQQKAVQLKHALEGKWSINRIDIDGKAEQKISVLIDDQKAQQIGLSLGQIAQTIRSYNTNQPLGNFQVGDLDYDVRIQWEIKDIQTLSQVPIATIGGPIPLDELAEISIVPVDERMRGAGGPGETGNVLVTMVINKQAGANIFDASNEAKTIIEQELATLGYANLHHAYVQDMAELIRDDYRELAGNAAETLLIVFVSILLYLWRKESVIATVSLPLSFMITFIALKLMGRSLNFLTNFSFIICLGIAIDTTTVIIQWAYEKMKAGYNPTSGILLSVREFSLPLIASTATACIVYIPMLSLPGILGKFLAYIPITIFTTLVAGLLVSLTVNSALYYKLTWKSKTFMKGLIEEEYLSDEERETLEEERKGKTETFAAQQSKRDRIINSITDRYIARIRRLMASPKRKLFTILFPLVATILSFVLLGSRLWFELVPSEDNPFLSMSVAAKPGTNKQVLAKHIDMVESVLSIQPEIKSYTWTINNDTLAVSIELLKPKERTKGMRNSAEVEAGVLKELAPLISQGYTIGSDVQRKGPPSSKAIGIKLIASSNEYLDTLIATSKQVEMMLKGTPGTKNVTNSSRETPGQFVFSLDWERLKQFGLTPRDVGSQLSTMTQGVGAWSLRINDQDLDIKVQYANFIDRFDPQRFLGTTVQSTKTAVPVSTFGNYVLTKAISSVKREDTNITISIDADVQETVAPSTVQAAVDTQIKTLQLPAWIRYEQWWENQANADLINTTVTAFIISLLLIFGILVLQFNSYSQPVIIMYTVLMGFLWANIGLYLTGNPYSMSFGIGFIALTGIVVNIAIVFIDKINTNIARGMSPEAAVVDTGKTRLQPILLTQLNTVFGLWPTAVQDKFFAGLAYTVMFGLGITTMLTIFVIPLLYLERKKLVHIIKRGLLSPLLFLLLCGGWGVWIVGLVSALGFMEWWSALFMQAMGGVSLLFALWHLINLARAQMHGKQPLIDRILGLKLHQDHHEYTLRRVIQRLLYKFAPFIIGGICLAAASTVPALGAVGMLIIAARCLINAGIIWMSAHNQSLYDRRLGNTMDDSWVGE